MTKIKSIEITNFKAIDHLEANFKGCTAIITGANDKGKTSFLRGIADRIRGTRPEIILHDGAAEGSGILSLTDGSKFEWSFDVAGKDKLVFYAAFPIDEKGKKATKEICDKYFPPLFDIDRFVQSSPKDQSKQLQKIVGLDFTEIDNRHKVAYDDRTERNRESEKYHAKLAIMLKVPEVAKVDLGELQKEKDSIKDKLNAIYIANKKHNSSLLADWSNKCDAMRQDVESSNVKQGASEIIYTECQKALDTLVAYGYDGTDAIEFVENINDKRTPKKEYIAPTQPEYIPELPNDTELREIDSKILAASKTNVAHDEYRKYIDYVKATEEAAALASKANERVVAIEAERQKMLETANFPEGVSITFEGVTIDGLPLDPNKISKSKMYTTALRIGAMNLGIVKTMHFDAGPLDHIKLQEIQEWAKGMDLQLLIERPSREGEEVEIEYHIIENTES